MASDIVQFIGPSKFCKAPWKHGSFPSYGVILGWQLTRPNSHFFYVFGEDFREGWARFDELKFVDNSPLSIWQLSRKIPVIA